MIMQPSDEGRVRMKAWLLAGVAIPDEGQARKKHVGLCARGLALSDEAELDASARAIWPVEP